MRVSTSKFCALIHDVILHLFPCKGSNGSNRYYLSGIYVPGVYVYYLRVSQPPRKVVAGVF